MPPRKRRASTQHSSKAKKKLKQTIQKPIKSKNETPGYTIYVTNLNDKIPNDKMKQNLLILFSTYSDVISILYKNKGKLRGQAWVAVSSIAEAQLSISRLQEEEFFGKKLDLQFSLNNSKIIEQYETTEGTIVQDEDEDDIQKDEDGDVSVQ